MKKIVAFVWSSVLGAWCCIAQPVTLTNQTSWSVPIEPVKRFIENKSQFDGRNELPNSDILYGVDWGATQIFFTHDGLTYRFEERKPVDKFEELRREKEREEKLRQSNQFTREEDEEVEVEHDVVQMQWLGANPATRLTGLEETGDYFSYTIGKGDDVKNINHIKGYEKLLYENLYPNIDVEYTFHPNEGIKYKIILHPGADVSQIRMKYSGTEKITNDESGNIVISTSFGDIIDHAPLTFYSRNEKKVIDSRFKVSDDDVVSFVLDDYKNSKMAVIDPWTVTLSLAGLNKAYYIKSDGNGNAYVYGGETPYLLQKYDSTGALKWTYNTPWSASGNWFGTLAVDFTGNSYITSGTGNQISKINTTGGLVWISTSGGGPLNEREYWAMDFNCDYSKLVVGGTLIQNIFPLQGYGAIFEVNLGTGAVTNPQLVAHQTSDAQIPLPVFNEVRSLCAGPTGDYYYLTIDTIGSLDHPSLAIRYNQSSSYRFSYYLPYGQGGTGQGTNGIRATPYFLYTTNGQILYQRDINNGNILNQVFIPSGAAELCSGVTVDSCGNVYVGSVGQVVKYDGNLNLITSATTPGQVYDVSVTNNGEVLACGLGFAMSIDFSACKAMRNLCVTPFPIDITSTDVKCNGACEGTATATPQGGTAPYSYLWSNGQTVQTATNLCAGTYLVTVTDVTNSYSIASVIIKEPPVFTVTVTSSTTTCGTGAIAIPNTGTSPFSYEWSNGGTGPSITGLATGTYSVTVSDANGCSAFGSVSVTQSPGFQLSTTTTNPSCGNCDGSATVTVTGGNPPFIYEWSTGDTTASVNGLCADIYYVTASANPSGSNNVFWNEDFSGGNSGWTLSPGPGANGNSPNRWVINNNRDSTDCPVCPSNGSGGYYLHVSCDSASFFCLFGTTCTYSTGFPFLYDNTSDQHAISPNISTIGKNSIVLSFWYMCVGDMAIDYGTVSLSNDGGNSWTDLPTKYSETPACTQAMINLPAIYENIPNFRIRFRWVNNNDMNGNNPPFVIDDITLGAVDQPCSAITSIILESDAGPAVNIDSIRNVSCKNASDDAILTSVLGGTPPYIYNWSNGDTIEDISGLNGGSYFVIVTDSADCVAIEDTTITEPTAIAITGSVSSAGCTSGGSIDISASGGTQPYTYLWTNGDTSQDISNVQSGAYEVTVTDFNHCTKTALFNVSSPAIFLSLEVTDASCGGVSDGSVNATLVGGSPPFQYSWSNGDTTQNLTALPGGTYSLTVTDNSGCSAMQSATVNSPSVLAISFSPNPVKCKDGSDGGIKVNPSGGTPNYSALWSTGQTGLTLTALPTGMYSVTVTDAAGCTIESSITLGSTSIYSVETTASSALCDGTPTGSLLATIISGTTPPYSYEWSTGDTVASISNVAPGIYTITVSDELDCNQIDTIEVVRGLIIGETIIPACPNQSNGSIFPRVSGGVEPYSYTWSTGATTPTLVNIDAGTYSFTVADQNGCRGNDTVIVMTDTSSTSFCDTIIFYEVFSPNGDGINEQWVVDGVLRYPENELQIFNRWGNVVFEAIPYTNDWDGTSKKGELLPSATYYYILKLNDAKKSVYSGSITLVR